MFDFFGYVLKSESYLKRYFRKIIIKLRFCKKLFEEFFIVFNSFPKKNFKILKVKVIFKPWNQLIYLIDYLEEFIDKNDVGNKILILNENIKKDFKNI